MTRRPRLRGRAGIGAAFGAALALAQTAAYAQSATLSADELRPLYANADDIREGKQLADTACAKCHGPDGVSATSQVPHLAGQRPSYVYRKLQAFRRADRPGVAEGHDKGMLKFLNDDALANVAAYYASLDPPPPPPGAAPKYKDPLAAGKAAAQPCAKCHGEGGVSHKDGVPSLVGLAPKYLVESMKDYRDGDRPVGDKNADMKTALDALNDKDLENIANFYASQSDNLTRAQTSNPGAGPVAKEAIAACDKCHGDAGVSTSVITPSLAGQDETYALAALRAYRDGTRDDVAMSPKAKKLSDSELTNFAAYYAALAPKPVNIPRPLSPDEWADKCDRCHGANGNSARPDVPALAGQRADYIEKALGDYRKGVRMSAEMDAMSSILTDEDIKGLAAHYAFQKGRPAIFVPVPAK